MVVVDLFSSKGCYDVLVREICDTAGVTKPVLYHYLKDKEDFLIQIGIDIHAM